MIEGAARSVLLDELTRLRDDIARRSSAAGQVASGRTLRSMRVEVSESEGTLFGRSAFGTLETGRRGGKVPMGFSAIIKQWMYDKGIRVAPIPYKTNRMHKYTEQERGENTFAFFVARKISREGSLLFRKGGRGDIYSDIIPETRKRIRERIIGLIKLEVSSIKINNAEI